jgi:ribosomal protein S18 acetylase RimI-like enzyme
MVSIRRYSPADRDALRELVLELHETLQPFDADLAPGDQIIEQHFTDLISKVQQTAGTVLVAEDDGRLIGYVCLWGSVAPEDLDERPDPFSFMAELFVLPQYRCRAIGRRLVEEAERYAAGCGAYKVELKVLARNESALRFYESLGYAPRVLIMSKRTRAGDMT